MKATLPHDTIMKTARKALAFSIVASAFQYGGPALGEPNDQALSNTSQGAGETVVGRGLISAFASAPAFGPRINKNETIVPAGTFIQQVRAQSEGFRVLLGDFRSVQTADRRTVALSKVNGTDPGLENHFMDAVRTAIQRHPSVHSGALGERQAVQGIDVARSFLYPQVTGSLEGAHTLIDRPGARPSGGFEPTAALTVSQLLYDGGATFDRIDAAQGFAEAERYNSRTKAQLFALRAVSTYMGVTRLETLVLLAQDNLAVHELLLDRIQQRTAGGVGNRADVLRARGRLADARAQFIGKTGEYEQIISVYQEVFGKPPTHAALPKAHPQFDGAPNVLVSEALKNNFAINRAQSQSQAARFESDAEQASRFPKLSLEIVGREYEVNRLGYSNNEALALIKVDFPFYTGGRLQAQRQRATLKYAQAKADEQALRLEVERQVRSAVTDISARAQKLVSQELAVEAGRQTFDNYLELFTVGRRSFTDLLDTQRDLFLNSVELVNARVELDLSRFILSEITGNLLEFFNVADIPDHE